MAHGTSCPPGKEMKRSTLSEGHTHRSRTHYAEVRFRDLAEASFSTLAVDYRFLVFAARCSAKARPMPSSNACSPSVTFVDSVETNKRIFNFFTIGYINRPGLEKT